MVMSIQEFDVHAIMPWCSK